MGFRNLTTKVGLALLVALSPLATVQAALITMEVDGQNPTLSGSQAASLTNINQVQVSYSYQSQNDCSTPCNDVLLDLQVHLSSSLDFTNSFHWNLGKFINNGGNSTGQLWVSGNSLQFDSSETIAGSALAGASATRLRLLLSGISNLSGTATPLDIPTAALATLCIGDNIDPCAGLSVEFTPQFHQRQLPLQWANPLPQGNKITKILWNEAQQQYLAVGHNGTIMSSSNGVAWSMQGRISAQFNHDPIGGTSSEVIPPYAMFDDINALIFANNRYVAAGRKFVAVSRFGIDWSYHYRPRGDFLDVAWDSILGSRYIAVGNWLSSQSNIIFSDQNAMHWSDTQAQVISNTRMRKILAGGDSRYYGLKSSDGSIVYSGNSSLSLWSSGNTSNRFNDIIWDNGNNLAIAVGEKNAIVSGSVASWTPLSMTQSPNAVFHSVTALNNNFIAVGLSISCTNIVEFSLPATVTLHNWNSACSGNTPVVFQLAYDGSQYISSTEDRKLYTSANLNSDWQLLTQGQENDIHAAVFASGNQSFYAVGNLGYLARSSDNGVSWSALTTSPASSAALYAVAADSNAAPVVVAAGGGGNVVRVDEAGLSPTTSMVVGSDTLRDIAWVGDKFIMVGDNNQVFVSADGLGWNNEFAQIITSAALSPAEVFDFSEVFFANNRLFILGTNRDPAAVQRTVLLQSDQSAANWQANPSPLFESSSDLFTMAWSGNVYVISALGENQDLLLSNDGDNWTRGSSGGVNDSPISRLLWTGAGFIGIGPLKNSAGGLVYPSWFQSRDGYDWIKTRAPLNFNSDTRAYPLAISNTALVTGGGFGSLLYMLKNYNPSHLAQKISVPANLTGQAGTPLTISANESDAANIDTRQWRFIAELSDPVSVAVNSATNTLNLTLPDVPKNLRPNNASMVLRYTVVDKQGTSSSAQANVQITPSNQLPVINDFQSSSGSSVVESEIFSLTAQVSDADGDPIVDQQWSVSSGPALDLSACHNLFSCQLTAPNVSGNSAWVIHYKATDSLGGSAETSINLTIVPNQAPNIVMHPDISVLEGETYLLDALQVSDDGPVDQLRINWEVDSVNSDFNPGVPVILTPRRLNTLIVAPQLVTAQAAKLVLRLTVTDNLDKSASASMVVTVKPRGNGQFPQANAGADQPPAGKILAGSKVDLNAGATQDPNNQFDYEWYFAGAFAGGNAIELAAIDIFPNASDVKKASFIAPLSDINYLLVFNLRVSNNSLNLPLSSVDSVIVSVSANSPLVNAVDAAISLNDLPISGNVVEMTGGEPIKFSASNIQFKSNQQVVDVGTNDVSQYSFHWSSINYRFGGFDAVTQSTVQFPPIATVSGGTYQFVLRLCDHYELVCSDKTIYLTVKPGGFAGVDQSIAANVKTVILQFNDAGRTNLDSVRDGNGYETVLWEQITPDAPRVKLKSANAAKASFSTSGLSKGDYVFRLNYSLLGVPNEANLSDEVTITIENDIPAYKPAPPQSTGGALSFYLLLLPMFLLLQRQLRLRMQREMG